MLSLTSEAYQRASRLMPNWTAARVTKASRMAASFSNSSASRRIRPNQEGVRSTTQGCLTTSKPIVWGSRRTTSSRRPLMAAASSVCWAL